MNFRTKAKRLAQTRTFMPASKDCHSTSRSRPPSSRELSFDSTEQSSKSATQKTPKHQQPTRSSLPETSSPRLKSHLVDLQELLLQEREKGQHGLSCLQVQEQYETGLLLEITKHNELLQERLQKEKKARKDLYGKLAGILGQLGVRPGDILPCEGQFPSGGKEGKEGKELGEAETVAVQQKIIKKLLDKLGRK